MTTKKKLHIAIIFGGRSGEHEVSLMSARSVLSVLDPAKYEVTQIGITTEGKWLTGDDVLGKLEHGKTNGLEQVVVAPDPSETGIYVLRDKKLGAAAEGWRRVQDDRPDVIVLDLRDAHNFPEGRTGWSTKARPAGTCPAAFR